VPLSMTTVGRDKASMARAKRVAARLVSGGGNRGGAGSSRAGRVGDFVCRQSFERKGGGISRWDSDGKIWEARSRGGGGDAVL
jgi:hypothetical protein